MKPSIKQSLLALGLFSVTLFSCTKEDPIPSPAQKALTANSWQVERVTQYTDGAPEVTYLRGGQNNSDDFSLVRQTYKANGSIDWIDSFGDSGGNGRWQLLDGNRKLKLTMETLSTTVENVKLLTGVFAYTLKVGDGDSTRFEFSPL